MSQFSKELASKQRLVCRKFIEEYTQKLYLWRNYWNEQGLLQGEIKSCVTFATEASVSMNLPFHENYGAEMARGYLLPPSVIECGQPLEGLDLGWCVSVVKQSMKQLKPALMLPPGIGKILPWRGSGQQSSCLPQSNPCTTQISFLSILVGLPEKY